MEEITERNEDAYSSCAYSFRVAHSFLFATSTFPLMHLICPPPPNFAWALFSISLGTDVCKICFFLGGGGVGKCWSSVCDSMGSLKFRPRKDRRYYIRQIHRLPLNILSLWKKWNEVVDGKLYLHNRQTTLFSCSCRCHWNRALIISFRQFLFVQVTRSADFAQLACSSCKIHLNPEKGTPLGRSLPI